MKFEINGKKYNSVSIGYEQVCDLEDLGVSLDDFRKKPLKTIRAYLELCSGLDSEEASKEIEQHIIKGGTLDKLSDAFNDAVENSDFFQALAKKEEEEDATSEK